MYVCMGLYACMYASMHLCMYKCHVHRVTISYIRGPQWRAMESRHNGGLESRASGLTRFRFRVGI